MGVYYVYTNTNQRIRDERSSPQRSARQLVVLHRRRLWPIRTIPQRRRSPQQPGSVPGLGEEPAAAAGSHPGAGGAAAERRNPRGDRALRPAARRQGSPSPATQGRDGGDRGRAQTGGRLPARLPQPFGG